MVDTQQEMDGRPETTSRLGKQNRKGSLRYRFQVARQEPTAIVGLLAAALLAYLIITPILSLLNDGIRVQFGDENRAGQPFGSLTTYYLERVFFSPTAENAFWRPLYNTLQVSAGAIIVALLVGGVLAWVLSRTDMFGRKWFATALIVPYMVPSWTFAMAWSTVFRNRTTGGTTGWLEAIGLTPPNWLAYGAFPITLILALHYTPFVILLFGGALRNFDSQLEDAARILGANRRVVARRIILPLMRPSLLSATTLIFAKCLGDFGVAYILGVPVGYNVLATSLFRNIQSGAPGAAAVLAGAIILIGAISLIIDARLVREAKRFVTISSKTMDRRSPLGPWRMPVTLLASLVFLISVALPLLVLFLTTVMRVPGRFEPSNFTLDFWIGQDLPTLALPQGLLLTPEFWQATWNTIWIVGLAAVTAGLLGLLTGYVVARSPVRGLGMFLRQVTFMPYLVPGIAFAAAFLSLFAVQRGPIPALYGTSAILILALIADQMPYASRAGISSMMQLGKEPEEAAQVHGANWFRRMRTVVLPIQKRALVSGALLPFISGIKGLSLVVLLAVPGTDLLTTYTIRLVDYGYTQAANAVVLMICAIAFFGTYGAQKLTKSGLSEGLGGK